jgi:hypothetical protein
MSGCERWIGLSDAAALGEALSVEEANFLRSHQSMCASCGAEHRLYQSLAGFLDAPAPTATQPIAPPAKQREASPRRIATKRVALAAAGLAALAAGMVLLLGVQHRPPPSPDNRLAVARIASVGSGGVTINGLTALAGTALRAGDVLSAADETCLSIEPSVRSCLSAGTVLQIEDLGLVHRRLRLVAGEVFNVLDPQPVGTSFGIVTSQGESVAVGTAFQVAIAQGQMHAVTRVLHGIVAVSSRSGRTERVVAHQAFDTADGQLRTMPASEERAFDEQLNGRGQTESSIDGSAPSGSTQVSATALLAEAQQALSIRDWAAAANAFSLLESSFAQSDEAQLGRLTHADLALGALQDPSTALTLFDAYLSLGGKLNEQAAYGRIRALRAVRKTNEAAEALNQFRVSFPESSLLDSP